MKQVLGQLPRGRNCVGIVDPPRSGLHSQVIVAVRKFKQLKRLVYVSCNPK